MVIFVVLEFHVFSLKGHTQRQKLGLHTRER